MLAALSGWENQIYTIKYKEVGDWAEVSNVLFEKTLLVVFWEVPLKEMKALKARHLQDVTTMVVEIKDK